MYCLVFFISIFLIYLYLNTLIENIFLKTQLDIFKSHNANKKLRASKFQKIILAFLYILLRKPVSKCFAFTPETLLKWYKLITKKFYTFIRNKNTGGRPPISKQIIDLIIKLHNENTLWGCRRIRDELKKLNIKISKSSIYNILLRHGFDPYKTKHTWRKFISSHLSSIIATDFRNVMSLFGTRYYIMFFIAYDSRKIIHFNITKHPTKVWIENQLREISDHSKKIYLIHDNDMLFEHIDFEKFNIVSMRTAIKAPKMNAVVERFIGSFKREALNHFIIVNQKQLMNIALNYVYFYNNFRPHQGKCSNPLNHRFAGKGFSKNIVSTKNIKRTKILNGVLNHYFLDKAA